MSTANSADPGRDPGFDLFWRDAERVLHRGWHEKAGGERIPVLAVRPSESHPQPGNLARLAHEYGLKESLESAWAARPLEFVRERGLLLLEDPGGEPLARLVGAPMELGRFLRLAIPVCGALARMHASGLIHKDIKPSNVLINPEMGAVWLTGFGIASRVPRERQSPAPPEVIAGTLAYMAPEQTGRMNRSIDARSDLYALGVTLYELLTGVLPFSASDPMEWIHCHIARQPLPPAERVHGIPEPVCAIIMKLLAKAAEDRYQTATGLRADLQRCLADWEAGQRVQPFRLGAGDASGQLLFRETLYGRERETARLVAAFDRVVTQGTSSLVLVSGYSGIGKSSVVKELHKALVPPRGLFAAGKFDQYKRGIPYATLAQAFQGLVRQLLSKNDAELARWRSTLTQALGRNGQLMINLIPELALIIGEQQPVPELSGPEAQSRFLMVFRQFLGVFARPEHPLVMFLDDLQWLDSATLDVFEHLAVQPDARNFLLVGAYRDNEVSPEHPLSQRLDVIRRSVGRVEEIVLGSIEPEHVATMIADALGTAPQEISALALTVFEKTAGNPFFTIQFVSALADEGSLIYDPHALRWSWDVERIRARSVGENVVDLMVERLNRLPGPSLLALQQLACLGTSFGIATFSLVIEASAQETQSLLHEPLRVGLLLQIDGVYAFAHDRVHEATYAMLPGATRASLHRTIGSRLLAALSDDEVDAQIFEIVSQFNRGALHCTDTAERATAAALNLRAARKARASAAYAAACSFVAEGRAQLGEAGWSDHHELALELAQEDAECTFLMGAFDATEKLIASVLANARTSVQKATAYRLKVELHVVKSENEAAVESGLSALRLFGIEFSPHPGWAVIEREYNDIWKNLNGRPIDTFADLPAMIDPEMLAVMRVLAELYPPAYFTDFNLMSLLICRMVNLSLIHGAADASNQALALLGCYLLGPAFGRYEEGSRIGELACELSSKRSVPLDMARVRCTMGLTSSWTHPLTTSIDWFRSAYRIGVEAGDLYFACYSSALAATELLLRGHDLRQEADECMAYLDFARSIGFRDGADLIVTTERAIAGLRGLTRGLADFSDDEFDEAAFEAELTGARMNVVVHWYWTRKIMLHFLSANYEAALAAADKVQPGPWVKIVQIQHLDYHYYSALALAARIDHVSAAERKGLRERLAAHYEQLRTWAEETGSPTFADKHVLIGAEIARLDERDLEAQRLYEDSIRLAHENGFLQNEAVANELAGRFYAQRGFAKIALTYLRDARSCYLRWGAHAKVRQLDELHQSPREEPPTASRTTTVAPLDHLDLATVIKVSQAVSGEIVLDKLIETLMRTAMEHAGAERAVLILSGADGHRVEAEAVTAGDAVTVHLCKVPLAEAAVAQSVVHYVMRTRESMILGDASAQSPVFEDAYIRRHRSRSLLCLPLMNQAKLIGLLYLENNLSARVFTANRIAVLKLLASQAAISLENTRLYRDLAEREARIRRLVESNVIGIVIWDLDGRLIDANDAFLRMLQYDREDLHAGLSWFDMTPPEWQEVHALQELEELKATGAMQPREKEYFRKDGSRVPVLIGAAAFDGQPERGVAYILDLTESKQAEERFRESERRYRELQSELAHANRVATMGQLSAWIAHDVKQPLLGVVTSGNAGLRWLAADPPNVEAARRAFERIVRDGHRAADILDRTRALVKKAAPRREAVDINRIILETIALVEAEAKRNGILVRVDLDDGVPLVSADRIQVQQVILNLIVNAIEAMTGDTAESRDLVVVSRKDPSDHALVAVQDSGPGLPAERLQKVFDAFFTTKPSGLGMGLAICRTIVESYGGKIWVTPNVPRGTVFQFALPRDGEEPRPD